MIDLGPLDILRAQGIPALLGLLKPSNAARHVYSISTTATRYRVPGFVDLVWLGDSARQGSDMARRSGRYRPRLLCIE